tara:strand:+ start:600 stop:809 length:210 start_codon:yes stop_codon:yes gene_type:complete
MTEDKWIKVNPKTEGLFSKEAKKNKMTTQAYAKKVIKELRGNTDGNKNKIKKLRRAVFAQNAMKASKKK